jgi:small subunit ribosomal protein S5
MIKNLVKDKEIAGEAIMIDAPAEMEERTVAIDRISRTVKGGRRIRFRALVVLGDRAGHVGIGLAKANDVQTAIAKAKNVATRNEITVPVTNDTIKHEVSYTFVTTTVLMKPAGQGHSIIAGGPVRAVVELSGIKNIVCKTIGSSNTVNSAMAAFEALKVLAASNAKGKK